MERLAIIRFAFVSWFRVRGAIFGPYFFIIMMMLIEGSFWNSISGDGGVGGYSANSILFYSFSALVFFQITSSSGDPDNLSGNIESGRLDSFLVKPCSYFYQMCSLQLGQVLARFVCFFPFLALISFFLRPEAISFLMPSLLLGLAAGILNFLINHCISVMTFHLRESQALLGWKETLFWILSGTLVPLDFFPQVFREMLIYFPPAYVVYYPVQFLMGKVSLFQVLFFQILFISVVYMIFEVSWSHGLKKYQAYGG